jgi:menaquinol-cytochrome c reductase cytochrome b/c subunit
MEDRMSNEAKPKSFSPEKSKTKTYSLVELVKAPTTMADHGPDESIFSFPTVALLELLLTLGVIAFLVLFSLGVDAPLEEIANPNTTTDPAKAPWYFMGLQELLEHGHPTLMAVGMPTLMVLFVISIPYIDNVREGAGVWFTSKRGKKITKYTAIYTAVVMPAYVYLDSTYPLREILRGQMPDFILQIVIPGILMAVIVLLPLFFVWRIKPTPREWMLTLFTVLFVGAIIFTLTGFLFRGPGFKLYWPWGMPGGYSPWNNL